MGEAAASNSRFPEFVVSVADLDGFVRSAEKNAEFIYCRASAPPRDSATWKRAGELARDGLVTTHSKRICGVVHDYIVMRTARPVPPPASEAELALSDRANALIYDVMVGAAEQGLPCPSTSALAQVADLASRDAAQYRVRRLIDAGLIESELVYCNRVATRVVTIVATGNRTAEPGAGNPGGRPSQSNRGRL